MQLDYPFKGCGAIAISEGTVQVKCGTEFIGSHVLCRKCLTARLNYVEQQLVNNLVSDYETVDNPEQAIVGRHRESARQWQRKIHNLPHSKEGARLLRKYTVSKVMGGVEYAIPFAEYGSHVYLLGENDRFISEGYHVIDMENNEAYRGSDRYVFKKHWEMYHKGTLEFCRRNK